MSVARELRRDMALTACREILEERLWLPIYEDGGVDALISAKLVRLPVPPPPAPPESDRPSIGTR